MKNIRTVLGDIQSSDAGFTYSHEHLYAVPPCGQRDRDLELSSVEKSKKELMRFKNAGGNTLCEASTIDYGRNISALVEISSDTGVNVVCTTGFNKHIYYPDWVAEKSAEEISDMFASDLTCGIDGTSNKAGFIKGGSFYNMIHPLEEKTTIAAALGHKKTNAPIWMHTEAGTMPLELLDILEDNGVDMSGVAIGHMDRNLDDYLFLKILERGCYIQFDGPGKVKYYPDSERIKMLKLLAEKGLLDRVLISGDMGRSSYLHEYGGGPGFEFIIKKFTKRMLDEGFSQSELDTIFIENPARWLARF